MSGCFGVRAFDHEGKDHPSGMEPRKNSKKARPEELRPGGYDFLNQ
jgi:hypothetical protein